MTKWAYTKGLHILGDGIYAYLCPDGSWGLNNTGLVVDSDSALLVDTLFDLASTQEMLDEMREVMTTISSISTLVVTHGNGDHFYGNELVKGADIISTRACASEMATSSPQTLADLMKTAPTMGEVGAFFLQCFGSFKFEGIHPLPPTRTFEKRFDISMGTKEIQLIEVGPCHTEGDCMVYLPENKIVFAGDILFIGGTPVMWAGPVANWIRACDLMLEMDAEIFVPGHGPITDKKGVEAVKGYWKYVEIETKKRFELGMSPFDTAMDIPLGEYRSWGESERICVNVNTLYNEFKGQPNEVNILELFGQMAQFAKDRK